MNLVSPEAGFVPERLERIGALMQGLVAREQHAGIVTLLARGGKIGYVDACGWLDRAAGRPIAADSLFRIYSMTKPITATAVMILLEEGRLLLDDPLTHYLPEFAELKVLAHETEAGRELAELQQPITLRHLLTHTAGLAYGLDPEDAVDRLYMREKILRPDEGMREKMLRLAQMPLSYQPGARWKYSVALDVLGAVIERISGQSFGAFLQQRLFEPLGMVDTGFWAPPGRAERLIPVYQLDDDGALKKQDSPWFSLAKPKPFESGGGGLVSTVHDYFRFAQMLLNGGELEGARILGRKTVELLTANQPEATRVLHQGATTVRELGSGQALGMGVLLNPALAGLPGSAGSFTWSGAAGTHFWVDPREELVAVLMTQRFPRDQRVRDLFTTLAYQALV